MKWSGRSLWWNPEGLLLSLWGVRAVILGARGQAGMRTLSASRWVGRAEDLGGWMSREGVKERVSRYTEGCSGIGGRWGQKRALNPGQHRGPLGRWGLVYTCEDRHPAGVSEKETGFEEVQTAGGHRIRPLMWSGSGRCCDVCRGSWD